MNRLLLFMLCVSFNLYGQNIQFKPAFQHQFLELNKKFGLQNDTLEFETLKFYISNIRFYNNGKLVDTADKKYFLMDLENPSSLIVKNHNKNFDAVKFNIGIDSITNISGVLGGDLDPTKGMYWAWHSGYINFKLEGKSKKSPARKNKFQFHIGGYEYPFNTLQEKEIKVIGQNLVIEITLDEAFRQIDLSKLYEVMSPKQEAIEVAKLFSSCFKLVK